jgi:UDP-N-acetylmuramoyl-L-alanyl-D-glutamate--2,6-diaminopimelate ligase
VAGFTNLTPDHLDHHGSMDAYWAAKRALFEWPALGAAVVNVDDARGLELAGELAARAASLGATTAPAPTPALWTVALQRPARLRGLNLRHGDAGLAFDVQETAPDGTPQPPLRLATQLVGAYNAANLLGVLAALRALGLPLDLACAALAGVSSPPGRLERVHAAGAAADIEVIVDYAHTPDALEQVLQALRPRAAARGGRLWCVFGCGGNRDATKRPLMGAIAARDADRVVLTSDNPRDETPTLILAQILAGTAGVAGHDEVAVIEDRREAIAHAVAEAAPGDVVLLAGKGHETTQEIAGTKRPFSDLEQARAALAARARATAAGGRA